MDRNVFAQTVLISNSAVGLTGLWPPHEHRTMENTNIGSLTVVTTSSNLLSSGA